MIYHVYANRSNIGDWLSAMGIQKLLETYRVKECLCDTPFVPETIDILSQATKKDMIIIGGGGLLMDYFLPFWERFLAIAERVPFCIWGVGYCDLKYENTLPPLKLIEEVINKSKLSFVRDYISWENLKNCHLPEPSGCPSLVLFNNKNKEQNKGILHVDNYTTVGKNAYQKMCESGKIFAKKNGLIYNSTNNRITKDSKTELKNVIDKYVNSEYILSSGLHGCILGVAMGKKVLAVSGDYKIDAFMESVGLSEWVIDSKEVEEIPKKLDLLINQNNVEQSADIYRTKNIHIANKIKQFINDKKVDNLTSNI